MFTAWIDLESGHCACDGRSEARKFGTGILRGRRGRYLGLGKVLVGFWSGFAHHRRWHIVNQRSMWCVYSVIFQPFQVSTESCSAKLAIPPNSLLLLILLAASVTKILMR